MSDRRRLVIGVLLAGDLAAVAAALVGSHVLLRAAGLLEERATADPAAIAQIAAASLGLWAATLAVGRLYALDDLFEGHAEYARLAQACTVAVLAMSLLAFWVRGWRPYIVREWIGLAWIASIVAVGAFRFAGRRVVRRLRRRGTLATRVLIAGVSEESLALARQFRDVPEAGVVVAGFLDDFLPPGTAAGEGLGVVGSPSALDRAARAAGATELIVVPSAVAWETLQDLLRLAGARNGVQIRIAPGAFDLLAGGVRVTQQAYVPLLAIDRARIRGVYALLKRAIDVGVALAALAVGAIPGALVAAALAAGTGPVLARQRVLGSGGRPFTRLRFRADGGGGLRAWLRASSFRRLPELFHVLVGQMSLVGPQPIPERRQAAYREWAPTLRAVKPGLVGPWRAVGRRPRSFDDAMRLSLHYVRTYSIWLDLQILAQVLLQTIAPAPAADAGLQGGLDDVHDLSIP